MPDKSRIVSPKEGSFAFSGQIISYTIVVLDKAGVIVLKVDPLNAATAVSHGFLVIAEHVYLLMPAGIASNLRDDYLGCTVDVHRTTGVGFRLDLPSPGQQ
jgi:hypothetical protein